MEFVARTQQTSHYQPINELELDLTFSASRGGVPALVNSIVFRTLINYAMACMYDHYDAVPV